MNRAPSPYSERAARRLAKTGEPPAWRSTLRRWMPLADPVSYLLAAVVLGVAWAGPALLDRVLSHLAGAP